METNAMEKIAEKSIVANIVGGIFGCIVGNCVTEVSQDIIEQVLPKPKDFQTKVIYGIGSYAIGGMAGTFAAEQASKAMNELSGGILTLKASVEDALKYINQNQNEEN